MDERRGVKKSLYGRKLQMRRGGEIRREMGERTKRNVQID
jgi:hypothetical protein